MVQVVTCKGIVKHKSQVFNKRILKQREIHKWIKRERGDIDPLSEWVKAVTCRSLILKRMKVLSGSMNVNAKSVFKPEI